MAARFYAVRGVETVANTYLRNARNCYDRWGAKGKVAQFDARHPRLHEEYTPASFTATIGTPVRQLDVGVRSQRPHKHCRAKLYCPG